MSELAAAGGGNDGNEAVAKEWRRVRERERELEEEREEWEEEDGEDEEGRRRRCPCPVRRLEARRRTVPDELPTDDAVGGMTAA
jgi:hypothetical protein